MVSYSDIGDRDNRDVHKLSVHLSRFALKGGLEFGHEALEGALQKGRA
jgi:hypothetical protein